MTFDGDMRRDAALRALPLLLPALVLAFVAFRRKSRLLGSAAASLLTLPLHGALLDAVTMSTAAVGSTSLRTGVGVALIAPFVALVFLRYRGAVAIFAATQLLLAGPWLATLVNGARSDAPREEEVTTVDRIEDVGLIPHRAIRLVDGRSLHVIRNWPLEEDGWGPGLRVQLLVSRGLLGLPRSLELGIVCRAREDDGMRGRASKAITDGPDAGPRPLFVLIEGNLALGHWVRLALYEDGTAIFQPPGDAQGLYETTRLTDEERRALLASLAPTPELDRSADFLDLQPNAWHLPEAHVFNWIDGGLTRVSAVGFKLPDARSPGSMGMTNGPTPADCVPSDFERIALTAAHFSATGTIWKPSWYHVRLHPARGQPSIPWPMSVPLERFDRGFRAMVPTELGERMKGSFVVVDGATYSVALSPIFPAESNWRSVDMYQ